MPRPIRPHTPTFNDDSWNRDMKYKMGVYLSRAPALSRGEEIIIDRGGVGALADSFFEMGVYLSRTGRPNQLPASRACVESCWASVLHMHLLVGVSFPRSVMPVVVDPSFTCLCYCACLLLHCVLLAVVSLSRVAGVSAAGGFGG